MTELKTRELHLRAQVADDRREVSGLGVPYGEVISIYGIREKFAPGSVVTESAKLFERHKNAIGRVISEEHTSAGWEIVATFSQTDDAERAYQLAKDGVYDGLSVGFDVLEYHIEKDDRGEIYVYDRALVREVSVVPFPAYPSAKVTGIRHDPNRSRKDNPMETDNPTPPAPGSGQLADDVREIREGQQDLSRRFDLMEQRAAEVTLTPTEDTRSAGAWLRALATNDEATVREYEALIERAYTGGTSADAIATPQFVSDQVRLIAAANPLADIFASSPLPEKGLKLEYGVLGEDSTKVEKQAKEGDNLKFGKVAVRVESTQIDTFGGYTELTRQQIERTTNVAVLDLHIRALALRAGKAKAAQLRADLATAVAANKAIADRAIVVADQTKYLDWLGGIIDAAEKFQDLGLPLDALIVDKATFKTLAGLSTNTRPLMNVYGDGANKVGEIDAKQLGGNLANVTVRVNLKQETAGAVFVNGEAIRQYASPIVELADENIVNLSKQFGLYYYAANALEIPGAILPVVATAPGA